MIGPNQRKGEEAKWVGRLFQSYLRGMSVLDLVQTLNADRVPFKSALKPRPDPWNKAAVNANLGSLDGLPQTTD